MTRPPTPTLASSTSLEPVARSRRRINFTLWQGALFAGAAIVGLAALSAAGLALGLALAGAGVLATVVLIVWVIGANLVGLERRR